MKKIKHIASFGKRTFATLIDMAVLFTVVGIYFQVRSLYLYNNTIANRYLGLDIVKDNGGTVSFNVLMIRYTIKLVSFITLFVGGIILFNITHSIIILIIVLIIVNLSVGAFYKRSILDLLTKTSIVNMGHGNYNDVETPPSFFRRWGAFAIDSLVITISITTVTLLHWESFGVSTSILGSLLAFAIQLIFTRHGASIGKRCMKLVIVDQHGNHMKLHIRALRAVTTIVEVGTAFPFTISLILALSKRKSSIHDMIFHTRVIKRK